MLTVPNILSILRFPLALAFLQENIAVRCLAIVAAMVTDSLDGFLARRRGQASELGAMLDPLGDKFFTIFVLTVLLLEGRLSAGQMAALLSRDIAVATFGLYLGVSGGWATYKLRAIWCGKVSTALQFFVIIALTYGYSVPSPVYGTFVALGVAALGELYLIRQRSHSC